MARNDGHNIGCGAIIAIMAVCTFGTIFIAAQNGAKDLFLPTIIGLGIGYAVASYVNSSDKFKDL